MWAGLYNSIEVKKPQFTSLEMAIFPSFISFSYSGSFSHFFEKKFRESTVKHLLLVRKVILLWHSIHEILMKLLIRNNKVKYVPRLISISPKN